MRCVSCGFENRGKVKFCGECGLSLPIRCPECGLQNPPGIGICTRCNTSLLASQIRPGEERRQLTVMFCDLVGSTSLSAQLDPEDMREVLLKYQDSCASVINNFGGHIAQYLGDGILVYFGYPVAHEDDAKRAVHAGLGILEAMANLNLRLLQDKGVKVAVRIGIHTGLVVVGKVGAGQRQEQLAMGEAPNIAARLQEIAEPNTVVIGASTYRLIQGFFESCELPPQTISGFSSPMQLYKILGESRAKSRLDVAITTGLTPLVGREPEVSLLQERWEQTKGGAGQVVLLSGEAGIGKSRMVQVLKDHVGKEPHTWLECRCSPYFQHSALYPVIDLLERTLGFRKGDSPSEKLSKLEQTLKPYGLPLPEVIPLIASLLTVPLQERYPPLNLTPQRQKQKTLKAVSELLSAMAAHQPVFFAVEDLHWVDPSTLELLSLIIEHTSRGRVLTLLTFRPEFNPSWSARSDLVSITLSRLPSKEVKVMVGKLSGGKALPDEVLKQLVTKTDGIPLFVEEITKMVFESGLLTERERNFELTGPLPPLAIPSTLQDSLMARLDRLATIKEVAQLGACLGREFTYELIHAVSSLDEAMLKRELVRLVDAELLTQESEPSQAITYMFKHALIQDAAYQSLFKSKRQQYHQQIAQVLETRFTETAEAQPELLAYHHHEAGNKKAAIVFWQKAGQRAIQRSANVEAISYLTKALESLKTLPETREHIHQELALQVLLGTPLIMTKGYGAPEVEQTYTRARELCQQSGQPQRLFSVLLGLWVYYLVRAELTTALELGKEILKHAQSTEDPSQLLEATNALGVTLYYSGELVAARPHQERTIVSYSSREYDPGAFLSIHHPALWSHRISGWTLWLLGYPAQALQRSHEASSLAKQLGRPFDIANGYINLACLHQFRREPHEAQIHAMEAIALTTEHGFPFWLALGMMVSGWALAEQGQTQEGLAQIQQGLAIYRRTGAKLGRPYCFCLLAEALNLCGQPKEGLNVLNEATAAVQETGERFFEAEVYRLQGELLLALSDEKGGEAEACFRQAIKVAQQKQAKSLELRAVRSLSRLLHQQGKQKEARYMLAEIYGWFTDGHDTNDIKLTEALLAQLA